MRIVQADEGERSGNSCFREQDKLGCSVRLFLFVLLSVCSKVVGTEDFTEHVLKLGIRVKIAEAGMKLTLMKSLIFTPLCC